MMRLMFALQANQKKHVATDEWPAGTVRKLPKNLRIVELFLPP